MQDPWFSDHSPRRSGAEACPQNTYTDSRLGTCIHGPDSVSEELGEDDAFMASRYGRKGGHPLLSPLVYTDSRCRSSVFKLFQIGFRPRGTFREQPGIPEYRSQPVPPERE